MKKLHLRSSQWIVDKNDNAVFGKGKMEILENIEKTGPMNQAARLMKMSYKTMWSKIKSTEKNLNTRIVHADRRSGTHLTREGKELTTKYRQLKEECLSADDRIFHDIFG